MAERETVPQLSAFRRIVGFLRPYWKEALLAPLLMLLEVAMDLAQPRFLERIVDVGIAQMDLQVVLSTGLTMLAIAFIGVGGGVGCGIFAVRAAHKAGADVRSAMFRKIQSLSFGNLDRLSTGKLITRLTNDVVQIQEVIMILLRIMVRAPFMLVGSIMMAVVTSPRLSLVFLVVIPILVAVLIVMIRRGQKVFARVQNRLDDVNTVAQENLAGVRVVKAFVRGEHEKKRFATANEGLAMDTAKAMRLMAIIMPANMLVLNLGIVAVLWFGGVGVSAGVATVGEIMAVSNYLLRTLFSVMMVGMLMVRLARALASANRVNEVLGEEPDIQAPRNPVRPARPQGRVVFDRVSFAYNGEPVLRDVSFRVEPGETVAILGATGSGKSTLVQLIPRFYDVSAGRVLLDGTDVRDVDPDYLRRQVVMALQDTVLFTGSIADNIRYGRDDATDDEVHTVAATSQVAEFASRFPDGLDTKVGQRGVGLSGGQKQRVAIARALVARPAVLILDDCTSAVDVRTEAKIHGSLAEREQVTTFVVAQRISTILSADRILLLHDGRLVGEGTHTELMETSSIYREIYDSQLGKGVRSHGD
jgi:ATP-binding cassette, subfamily B, multidrug efflux pump